MKAQAGRIDILVVNARFYEFQRMGDITEAHFDKAFSTNVRGLVFAVQKALPLLSPGASVSGPQLPDGRRSGLGARLLKGKRRGRRKGRRGGSGMVLGGFHG